MPCFCNCLHQTARIGFVFHGRQTVRSYHNPLSQKHLSPLRAPTNWLRLSRIFPAQARRLRSEESVTDVLASQTRRSLSALRSAPPPLLSSHILPFPGSSALLATGALRGSGHFSQSVAPASSAEGRACIIDVPVRLDVMQPPQFRQKFSPLTREASRRGGRKAQFSVAKMTQDATPGRDGPPARPKKTDWTPPPVDVGYRATI